MPLNKFSSRITQAKSQGAPQAMLYATGLRGEDMDKPQVGMHLLQLAEQFKQNLAEAGLVGIKTIGGR